MNRHRKSDVINIDFLNDLEVLLIKNKKEYRSFIKKNPDIEELDAFWKNSNGCSVVFHSGGCSYFIIFLRKHSRRVAVHEAVHMIHQICDEMGIPISLENTETVAYMTEYLAERCLECLGKYDE